MNVVFVYIGIDVCGVHRGFGIHECVPHGSGHHLHLFL